MSCFNASGGSFRVAYKLLIWGILGSFFITGPSQADILQDRFCSRYNADGVCQRYGLAYNDYTLREYRDVLKKEVPGKLYDQVKAQIKFTRNVSGTGNPYASLSKLAHRIFEAPYQEQLLSVKAMLLWIVKMLINNGHHYYPEVKKVDMAKGIHTVFAAVHNLDIPAAYSTDFLVHDARHQTFSFALDKKTRDVSVYAQPDMVNAKLDKMIMPFLLNIIRNVYEIHYWNSLESADWLINHISDLREGLVVELGAGNGHMSELLASKGIIITATDINYFDQEIYHFKTEVDVLSAEQAIAKYPDAACYLTVFPGWDFSKDIKNLIVNDDKWCYIVITAADDIVIERIKNEVKGRTSIETIPLPDEVFKTIYYSPEAAKLLIYRSLPAYEKETDSLRGEL